MQRTVVMLTVTLVMEIVVGLLGNRVLNAQQQSAKRTELLTALGTRSS